MNTSEKFQFFAPLLFMLAVILGLGWLAQQQYELVSYRDGIASLNQMADRTPVNPFQKMGTGK